ncbi:DUF6771 family protein [Sphingomonas prati]|uniref:Uncharacterized protein n=1 Tax=Sphingomonas prati TaxID=1843237 RepID=A0A7W9BWG5_9SPHN|nr:DUF6771 family protein [Sphingomonas prati]MBB5730928.1 hypothetical protein [Sphingomonas prati]GGE97913.1 hypothetical protein GCM10011404_33830 [Sphingomonas prati]
MDIEPRRLAEILRESPIGTRLGMTAADPRLRARAADRLAEYLTTELARPDAPDIRQLSLPIQ